MSNLVVVAIPEENDPVWKISSEKIPHLTLLFLGDAENADTQQIVQFVEHAVTLSEHGQFYLDVDHRGTLGDAEADVLFFNKRSWNLKWIKQFRGQLLQNQQIRTAYDSAPQHTAPQDWVPHLTLGYPETPAKPIPDDGFAHPIYSVCFDRIAVWTGDFDGPEFRLEWPDREFEGDLAVAYSDTQKAALAHYGAKGMKWGVRKAVQNAGFVSRRARNAEIAVDLGSKAVPKLKSAGKKLGSGLSKAADALGEHFYESSVYSTATHEAIHNQVGRELDSKIHRLQSAPKYRGKNLKTDKTLETEYHQDVAKVTDSAYRRAVKDHIGENVKGTKAAHYVDDARGARIEIRDKKTGVKLREGDLTSVQEINADRLDHAAVTIPEPNITIPLKLDDNGQIKAIGLVKEKLNAVDHGAIFVDELLHSGVKGMKWGVIRTKALRAKAVKLHKEADAFERAANNSKRNTLRKRSLTANAESRRKKAHAFERAADAHERKKSTPEAVAPTATSKVPAGARRKTQIQTKGGENHPASPDAIKVETARAKLKKSGPKTLSNQELREVAERLRLEQQAVELDRSKGRSFVRNLLGSQGKQAANQVARESVQKGFEKVKK